MLIEELDKNRFKKIDSRFYDSLPKYCDIEECGFPMQINEVLTQVECTNVRCPKKIAKRIEKLCGKMNIEVKYSDALNYVLLHKVTNPMYIFFDKTGLGITDLDKKMTLKRYVELNCLPFLSSSLEIFSEFDSLEDFYEFMEEDNVEFLEKQLELYSDSESEVSIRALKIYDVLTTFKQDLFEGLDYVELVEEN